MWGATSSVGTVLTETVHYSALEEISTFHMWSHLPASFTPPQVSLHLCREMKLVSVSTRITGHVRTNVLMTLWPSLVPRTPPSLCHFRLFLYGWAWESDDHQAYNVTQLWPMYTQLLCWTICTWWGFNPKNFGDKSTWIFFSVGLLLTPALGIQPIKVNVDSHHPAFDWSKGMLFAAEFTTEKSMSWFIGPKKQFTCWLFLLVCWLECSSNRESTWT